MKREIKFRAWYKGKMYEVYSYYSSGMVKIGLLRFPFSQDVIPDSVMQYTGLKDKNGKEIYGGDILKGYGTEIKYYIVKYEDAKFVLHHYFARWGNLSRMFEMPEFPVEVIGNIHENPEYQK